MDWIDVAERLPEDGETVIVFGRRKQALPGMAFNREMVTTTFRINLKGTPFSKSSLRYSCTNGFYKMNYVTHWMPFPDPPKN